MSETFFHDVIFLGSSLSGMISANLLAQKGVRVLVIDGGEFPRTVSGKKQLGPLQPAPLALNSLLFRDILRQLSFHPAEVQQFNEADPLMQVVLPGRRFSFYRDQKRLGGEIAREFPQLAGELNDYFERVNEQQQQFNDCLQGLEYLLPQGFSQRRESKRYFREHGFHKILSKNREDLKNNDTEEGLALAKMRQALYLAESNATLDSAEYELQLSRPFYLSRFKSTRYAGDWQQLKESLFNKITKRGGLIIDDCLVEELLLEKNKISGIRLSGYAKERVNGKAVVINGSPSALKNLLPQQTTAQALDKSLSKFKVAYLRKSLQFLTFADALPAGMEGDIVAVNDPAAELVNDNCLFVRRSPYQLRHNYLASEKILLCCDYLIKRQEEKALKEIERQVKYRILDLMPFLSAKEFYSAAAEAALKPPQFLEEELYLTTGLKSAIAPWHNFKFFSDNLYLTGKSVFPALGIDGEILAGQLLSLKLAKLFT